MKMADNESNYSLKQKSQKLEQITMRTLLTLSEVIDDEVQPSLGNDVDQWR